MGGNTHKVRGEGWETAPSSSSNLLQQKVPKQSGLNQIMSVVVEWVVQFQLSQWKLAEMTIKHADSVQGSRFSLKRLRLPSVTKLQDQPASRNHRISQHLTPSAQKQSYSRYARISAELGVAQRLEGRENSGILKDSFKLLAEKIARFNSKCENHKQSTTLLRRYIAQGPLACLASCSQWFQGISSVKVRELIETADQLKALGRDKISKAIHEIVDKIQRKIEEKNYLQTENTRCTILQELAFINRNKYRLPLVLIKSDSLVKRKTRPFYQRLQLSQKKFGEFEMMSKGVRQFQMRLQAASVL